VAAKQAILILEDGTYFEGQAIGAEGTSVGEVVFSTSMTGYQEMLTDPSYRGQILTLTYPLIGNYGVCERALESTQPQVSGFVVKELCDHPSNWTSEGDTGEFLDESGIVGIAGVDTRALTRKLRVHGVMMGLISTELTPREALTELATADNYTTIDFVGKVSTPQPYQWSDTVDTGAHQSLLAFGDGPRVVVVDYGTKRNILRSLASLGCEVIVLPYTMSAPEVLAFHPDGIVLSPGPGNPALLANAIETVRGLMDTVPIMGVCLGHQLLARAAGGATFKLKFGHRGANHPVKDLVSGRVHITSQNHGFAVDADSLARTDLEVSQLNLNDGTVEGMRHKTKPIFSIQYHPEASPGPLDNKHLFAEFVETVKG
jgi:carbamoyl-phosphate synthase small subunit